jgi:hypothetical protein
VPGATTTTVSTLIKPAVETEPTVLMYTNREFFGALRAMGMRDVVAGGDTAFRWKLLRSTGNSSAEVFTEGQAAPSSGNQTWAEAALSWVYHRAIVSRSGHARDAMKSAYLTPEWTSDAAMSGEYKGALLNLEDLMANTFLGSTNNGILIAVDSAGTYGGLARATYTDMQSYETAAGGDALTDVDMADTWEGMRDNDRGGKLEAILAPWNQVSNYYRLHGFGATTPLPRIMASGEAAKIDYGFNETGLSFHNARIFGVGDMTDTELVFMSNIAEDWLFATIRPIERKDLAITDDTAEKTQVSTGGTLVCRNPRTQAKVSNALA